MVAFRYAAEKVESRIIIKQEVLWVPRLGANDIGSLDGVAAEEHWEIEADNVVIAFLCLQLDRETSRVAGFIREFAAERDSRETNEHRSLLSNILQEAGFRECRNVLRSLEKAESSRAAWMDHALEVPGPVEVLLLLEKMHIAHERNTSDVLAVLGIWDRDTLVVREIGTIVLAFSAFDHARDLGDDVHRALVCAHHVRHSRATFFAIAIRVVGRAGLSHHAIHT